MGQIAGIGYYGQFYLLAILGGDELQPIIRRWLATVSATSGGHIPLA
jgi:hypothetical protein